MSFLGALSLWMCSELKLVLFLFIFVVYLCVCVCVVLVLKPMISTMLSGLLPIELHPVPDFSFLLFFF